MQDAGRERLEEEVEARERDRVVEAALDEDGAVCFAGNARVWQHGQRGARGTKRRRSAELHLEEEGGTHSGG